MANQTFQRQRRKALVLALAMFVAGGASAQTNTAGAVAGRAASGDTITITNPATGLSRTVSVGADGSYRFAQLPTGEYQIMRNGGQARTVNVSIGGTAGIDFVSRDGATTLDTVTVVGSGAINPIDVSSVESSTILTKEVIDQLPVDRNYTAVALLAPGTVKGDQGFGNLASFGGASVGENAYYINGFNVTNFRNGLGGATVPFDFYQEFQVKTGGYGAEFGRSTGGVINTVTKRGSNEWTIGARLAWAPDAGAEDFPSSILPDGRVRVLNQFDYGTETALTVYGGGPVIKDRLHFFALYEARNTDQGEAVDAGTRFQTLDEPARFWGVKLDWAITDNHVVEYTGFSDKVVTEIEDFEAFDPATNTYGASNGINTASRGGRNDIFKYTGYLTDNFTLSALYGKGEFDRTDRGDGDACPLLVDARTGVARRVGCATSPTGLVGSLFDTREAKRVDLEWVLGDHLLRGGWDREENTANDLQAYSGGVFWRLARATGTGVVNGVNIGAGNFFARQAFYSNGGNFTTQTSAFYLEDSWKIRDNLMLYIGLRNEHFNNLNANGESFIEIKNQWAPRLGFAWDVNGDGTFKVFGNAGRYHLPVATNTNARLAGGELFVRDYFRWDGTSLNADGTPANLGAQIGGQEILSDGSIRDVREIVDQDIDPMYQDEFILGFQRQISEHWTLGLRGISRDLKSTLDDMAIPTLAMAAWAQRNNMTFAGFNAGVPYILGNPGQNLTFTYDVNGDGTAENVELTAAEMGYVPSVRTYQALEFFFERAWDKKWFMQGSYTLAKSKGNSEGYVLSDRGTQGDAGLTVLFDFPQLSEYAYGYLPNDRRHTLKLFGAYKPIEDLTLSANLLWASGRPKSCFGDHPAPAPDVPAGYQGDFHYCNGRPVQRGTLGRNGTTQTIDLGIEYRPSYFDKKLAVKLDVFNVLNSSKVTKVDDQAEANGVANPAFGYPAQWQVPRFMRMTLSYHW